jgi:PilZ domain
MGNSGDIDRRCSERFSSLNLLTFCEKNPEGKIVAQGIAKTLDLSESGALIALAESIKFPEHIELEIALEEEIIRVQVDLIDQMEVQPHVWNIRLRFREMRPAQRHRLAGFIRSISRE